jgi:tRNA threonylcarbamoyladenosine biosynthesis protein TsaE
MTVDALELASSSPERTEAFGERIGRSARGGEVLALWGELGAGKTVLARGVAAGLGLDRRAVTSPTFIILREHEGGRVPLVHLDLYRLSPGELGSTGWQEALEAGGVTVIEWPDRLGHELPADRLDVRLSHAGADARRLMLTASGPRGSALLEEVRRDLARA